MGKPIEEIGMDKPVGDLSCSALRFFLLEGVDQLDSGEEAPPLPVMFDGPDAVAAASPLLVPACPPSLVVPFHDGNRPCRVGEAVRNHIDKVRRPVEQIEERTSNFDWSLLAFRWRIFFAVYAIPLLFIGPFAFIGWSMGGGLPGNVRLLYYNILYGNWNGVLLSAFALVVFLPLFLIPLWLLTEMAAFWQRSKNCD